MTTRSIKWLAAAAAAVAFTGGLSGADVPWTFIGDDTRPAASTATSATALASFASWTMAIDDDTSTAIAFSSSKPGFVIMFR